MVIPVTRVSDVLNGGRLYKLTSPLAHMFIAVVTAMAVVTIASIDVSMDLKEKFLSAQTKTSFNRQCSPKSLKIWPKGPKITK